MSTASADQADRGRVVDLRLYRLALIPAAIALVVTMFSLAGIPEPIEPLAPTGTFDGAAANATAREIVRAAPERSPGSAGDARIADLVRDRFADVPAGAVTEVTLEAEVGDDVTVRNVLLTLPGDPGRTIVIVAGRDSERGPGAASSAAATGVLAELAEALGVAGHDSTYILASTSGGPTGPVALLESLPERDTVDAVIVISQPGATEPSPPHALITSTDAESGPVQLRRSAERAVETQTTIPPDESSWFAELTRLAFPSGLGPQAPLIAGGFDAVAVSADGEAPLEASEDSPEAVSGTTIDEFGRSIHALVGAVDATPDLDHGPATYVELSGNLIPGWALAALALTLILPAFVVAVDACARVSRRGGMLSRGFAWAAARSAPFVGALALLYALALIGLIPRPEFPFDPGLYPLGVRAVAAFALLAALAAATAFLLSRFGVIARTAPPGALAATGLIAGCAAAALWIANPFLALLAVPTLHIWVLADGLAGSRFARPALILASVLALIPIAVALITLAGALELGGDAPWTLTIMIADGQIGLAAMLAAALLAAALLTVLTLTLSGGGRLPAQPRASVRGAS